MTTALEPAIHGDRVSLLRVLGPAHVWALGVGIVLVGEFTGYGIFPPTKVVRWQP